MPITSILKRATSYILGNGDDTNEVEDFNFEDNEILFCKNNVCVHPPALVREESDVTHYSGYLSLCTKTFVDQHNHAKRPTLFLTWIPNCSLRKCPAALENCSPLHHPRTAIALQNKDSLKEEDEGFLPNQTNNNIQIQMVNTTNPFLENYVDPEELTLQQQQSQSMSAQQNDSKSMNFSDYSETISISSSSDHVSGNDCCYTNAVVTGQTFSPYIEEDEGIIDSGHEDSSVMNGDESHTSMKNTNEDDDEVRELKAELEPLLNEDERSEHKVLSRQASAPIARTAAAHLLKNLKQHQSMTSVNITLSNPKIENLDVPSSSNLSSEATNKQIMRSLSTASVDENNSTWMTAEMYAYKHNLTFPESLTASPIVSRKQNLPSVKCRRFSVDLSQMRSLRLFFNDEQCTSGQLVRTFSSSNFKFVLKT